MSEAYVNVISLIQEFAVFKCDEAKIYTSFKYKYII